MQLSVWILAARPKTLFASLCPVAIGAAVAAHEAKFHLPSLLAALIGAVAIQIGTNYCNDYFDFFQGADTKDRKGPTRAVQAGLVAPASMLRATVAAFLMAGAATIYLTYRAGWPFLLIGGLGILCGVMYTAGRYSLAYLGLGDPFVLLFFGPIAVAGTYYVQALSLSGSVIIAGLAPGLLAVGLLVVNNLRDVEEDRVAGKKTLVVRFGKSASRIQYMVCVFGSALVPLLLWIRGYPLGTLLASLVLLPAAFVAVQVYKREGAALGPCLGMTAGLLLCYTILFCVGLRL